MTMEWKDATEVDERISREEAERCIRRQKDANATGPDDIP